MPFGERPAAAGEVDLRIASHPSSLRFARLLVEECCSQLEAETAATREIVQAVDEVVSNIIRHGYGGDTTQPIRIACRREGDAVEVQICDRGPEFDPFAQAVPPPEEMRRGGRGIFLVRSLMDGWTHSRDDGWNRIRLTKHCLRPGRPPERQTRLGA